MEHPADIGERSEAIIMAELIKRGKKVLVPWGHNHRYDLVVDDDGCFIRVQCKTGRLADGKIIFNSYSQPVNVPRRLYTKDEIEVFAVYCPQLDKVYWVPVADVSSSTPYLRVEPTRNNQSLGIRWARDYELA